MKNILIVCTANKTRSVMAMALANFIAHKSGKAGGFNFDSAGIAAMGSEVDEIARLVLSEAGIESAHTPVHFSKVNISAFDEIHVMTLRHKTALCSYHKEDTGLEEKIHILGVEDPFGKAKEAYHECLEKLREFYETFING